TGQLLAEFERIDRWRGQAIHVLKHMLHDAGAKFAINRAGTVHCHMQFCGMEYEVGPSLTPLAREATSLHDLVLAARWHEGFLQNPSPEQLEAYLAAESPNPLPIQEYYDVEDEDAECSNISFALCWLGLCKALQNPERLTSAESIAEAIEPTGRIGQALKRLAERLPEAEAHIDLLQPGTLQVDFKDGFASFPIDTRSKGLARRIKNEGPQAVGNALADEFLDLQSKRSTVLSAIWRAAIDRGWKRQEVSLSFVDVEANMFLGESMREVGFEAGESLTRAVRFHDAQTVLKKLIKVDLDFADACIRHLGEEDAPLPEETDSLRPRNLPASPPLVELTADVIAEMDAWASGIIRNKYQSLKTLREYGNRDFYDPAIDCWVEDTWWMWLAEQSLKRRPSAMATLVLLDASDPRGTERAIEMLNATEPHDELYDEQIEIAWRFRHELPDIARKWFGPDAPVGMDIDYHEVRALLGDPVAKRMLVAGYEGDEDDYPSALVAKQWGEKRQAKLHRDLIAWARNEHQCSPPEVDPIRLAADMGWRDVGEALEENPYLLAGLLTFARRADEFDEPGLLMGDSYVLAWSRLCPSRFLARVVATGRKTNLIALAEEAAHNSVAINPSAKVNLSMSLHTYRQLYKDLEVALAIAWNRCRSALGDA
ncbi:MAG: hypothetical protein R3E58_17895, partial [Phycisphaerae bacterium]